MTDTSLRSLEREVLAQYGSSGDIERGLLTRLMLARARAGETGPPQFLVDLEQEAIDGVRSSNDFGPVQARYVRLMSKAGLSAEPEIERLLDALNRFELGITQRKSARRITLEHVYQLLLPHWRWDDGFLATWWTGFGISGARAEHGNLVAVRADPAAPAINWPGVPPSAPDVVPVLLAAWHTTNRSIGDLMTIWIGTADNNGDLSPPLAMTEIQSLASYEGELNHGARELGRVEISGHQMIHLLMKHDLAAWGDPALLTDDQEPVYDIDGALKKLLAVEYRKRSGRTLDLADVEHAARLALSIHDAPVKHGERDPGFGAALAILGPEPDGPAFAGIVAYRPSAEATEASALRVTDSHEIQRAVNIIESRDAGFRSGMARGVTTAVVAVATGGELAISVTSGPQHLLRSVVAFVQRVTKTQGLGRRGLVRWARTPGADRIRMPISTARAWLGLPSTTSNPGILVQLVPQRVNDDGAAACARSVLMHLGIDISQAELSRRLDGQSSAKAIAAVIRRGARALGLLVRTIVYRSLSAEELSAHLNERRPVVLRCAPRGGRERCAVACGFDEENVVLMDPAMGAFVPVEWGELKNGRHRREAVVVVRDEARAAAND